MTGNGLAVTSVLFAGGVAIGVALAVPASAEALNGRYTATLTSGPGNYVATTYSFTPCGTGCAHLTINDGDVGGDLHLQGNAWSGPLLNAGAECTESVNAGTLVSTRECAGTVWTHQLSKLG